MQDSYEKSFSPYLKFNALITQTTESVFNSNFQSIEEFTKIGLDNFYAGINARTVKDFVSFTKNQPEVFERASKLLIKNSETYVELTNQAFDTTQALFSGNLKDMMPKVPEVKNKKAKQDKKDVTTAPKVKQAEKKQNKKTAEKAVKPKLEAKPESTEVSKPSSAKVSEKVTPAKTKTNAEVKAKDKKVDSPKWYKPRSKKMAKEKADNDANMNSATTKSEPKKTK